MKLSHVLFNRARLLGALVVLLVVASLYLPASGEPATPTATDRQIAQLVAMLLPRDHLSRHPLDAEMSRRALKSFLKSLDPMKVYFTQADVDAFRLRQNDLSEQVKRGDITFGYTVFKTFLARVDQRVALVDALLKQPQDFTVDEEMIVNADATTYAKTDAQILDKWRKRIKYDLLVLKVDTGKENPNGITGQAAIDKLSRRYRSFARRMHQSDSDELLEMYLNSFTTAFDPHTDYMSPSTLDNFDIQMRLELEGIGAALQSEDGYTVVNKIIPGGAAEKEGHLKASDKVVGVGQGPEGPFEDVVDMKLSDVVKLIRGKRGTVVRLEVIPAAGAGRKKIAITREKIELKDSAANARLFDVGHKPDGQPYKIGVIDLPSFYMDMNAARSGDPNFRSTTRDMHKILDDFNAQGVDALVLDLRRNGGGSLQEAINLTGLFIESGPVVQVKDADGQVQPYQDVEPGAVWKGPMLVLISKFSASASEILAGAIQDYHRGLIVGDHATHGKGTVQSLMELGPTLFRVPNAKKLGALKITMQQFYRPHGESTQKRGVLADVEIPSLTSHLDVGESDLEYPVEFDQVAPQPFQKVSYVDKNIAARLQSLSDQRRQASDDFKKVLKNIDRYLAQKEKKTVTLNEAKFMAERADLNADKEEQKEIEELNDPSQPGIKLTYYLKEVLAIAADYLQPGLVAWNAK
jgi:carboxyl-terminal processing protease